MRRAGLGALLLVLVAVVGAAAPAGGQAAPTPPGAHVRPDGHLALAWFYGGTTGEYADQITRMPGLSVISPTWWLLNEDEPGRVDDRADPALVQFAHDRGIAVWPLIGNRIDPDLTDRVLRDDASRARLVAEVVAAVQRVGADGVNVDFENLHDITAGLLTQLVAELKAALPGHVISVDVTAMTDTWVLGNWSTAFDRAGLGQVADYVMLMAYDQHNRLRRNGPVAGLTWVEESVAFLLRTVPPGRLVLGVPFYSRDWVDDPAEEQGVGLDATLGMAAMGRRLLEVGTQAVYDPVAGMDLHQYTDDRGRAHRVWHEDNASLGRKLDLVARWQLAGTAAWRAGFEDPPAWDVIDGALRASAAPGPRDVAAAALPEVPAVPTPPADAAALPAARPPGTGAVGATGEAQPRAQSQPGPPPTTAVPSGIAAATTGATLAQRPAALLAVAAAATLTSALGLGVYAALRRRRSPGR